MSLEFPPQHSDYRPPERGLVGGSGDGPVFASRGSNRTASIALVLGLVAFLFVWVPLSLVFIAGALLGIAAVAVGAFGIAAAIRLRIGHARAIAAIALGAASVLIFLGTAALEPGAVWFIA